MANNDALYDAVMAGAGGAAQRGWLIATNAGAYVTFAADVDILAVAVDLQIPAIAGGPSISQINLLQSITEAVLSARYPITNVPATYIDIARAIAALYNALNPFLKNKPTIIQNILAGTGISVSIVNSVATITSLAATWKTIFDLDLVALPTSWSNANGVYVMGGFSFVKYGTARQYLAGAGNYFGIENGVGFRTQPDTALSPATQSVINRPYLTLPLANVIPSMTRQTPVRLSIISALAGDAINGVQHYAGFSIQEDITPFRVSWYQSHAMTNNPAIASTFSAGGYSGPTGFSPTVNAEASAQYLTRRIMRTTLPQGFGAMNAVHEIAAGIVWPVTESDWRWTGSANVNPTVTGPLTVPLAGDITTMVLEFGVSGNGHNLPGPYFTRLKLEAMY